MGCSNSNQSDENGRSQPQHASSQRAKDEKIKGAAKRIQTIQLDQDQMNHFQKIMQKGDENEIFAFMNHLEFGGADKEEVDEFDDLDQDQDQEYVEQDADQDNNTDESDYQNLSSSQYEDLKQQAQSNGLGIIFLFGRSACGNCSYMTPILKGLVDKNLSTIFKYVKVDIDKCAEIGWEDINTEGGGGSLPFIKGYNKNMKFVGAVFGTDQKGLQKLVADIGKEKPSNEKPKLQITKTDGYAVLEKNEYESRKTEALNQGHGIIFIFGRNTCGNCKYMIPIVEELVNDNHDKLTLVQVNIDKCASIAWEDMDMEGGSKTLPFIKGYKGTQYLGSICGTDIEGVKSLANKVMSASSGSNKNTTTTTTNTNKPKPKSGDYEVLSKEQYEQRKKDATSEGKGVIFSFGRNTCGNCKYMEPIIIGHVDKNPSKLTFVKVDIDKCSGLGWEDMPREGGSKMLPFMKGYLNSKCVGTACGTDQPGLVTVINNLANMDCSGDSCKMKGPNQNKDENIENIPGLDSKLIADALKTHNTLRAKHGCPALKHDPELSKKAQAYADNLAKRDVMEHSNCKWGSKSVGENLAMCMGQPMTGKFMTDMWYDEIKDYDYDNPGFGMSTGHFTQVVWKNTTDAGFGVVKAKSGNIYSVGNYYPPGNYQGEFEEQVPRLR